MILDIFDCKNCSKTSECKLINDDNADKFIIDLMKLARSNKNIKFNLKLECPNKVLFSQNLSYTSLSPYSYPYTHKL